MDWGTVNYVNPPYSQKLKEGFINKAVEVYRAGFTCVLLLPVSTSSAIFHEKILPNASEIRFLKGRVSFIKYVEEGKFKKKGSGMHDSMIVIFKPGGESIKISSYSVSDKGQMKINLK